MQSIVLSRHPSYNAKIAQWKKFRLTYEGGTKFIEEYLIQRNGEEDLEFEDRKKITYNPAHAKSAIKNIINSIHQRINIETSRSNGSEAYNAVMSGRLGGVDLRHSAINAFIGNQILDELIPMGKVGVYVDSPANPKNTDHPYFYIYRAEDILNWTMDPLNPNQYSALLLKDIIEEIDEQTGLPSGQLKTNFRYLKNNGTNVSVQFFNEEGNQIKQLTLPIPRIPFVTFELSDSLLTDAADYQITLLNLGSSDVSYAFTSNIPVYIEQAASDDLSRLLKTESDPLVEKLHGQKAPTDEIILSTTKGRRYTKTPPAFINPSSEPLVASMQLSAQLKDDIRLIINLSLTTIKPRAASAEAKSLDERGLEAGLSAIGMELESGENSLAQIFEDYRKSTQVAKISYPAKYELKSEEERRKEAEDLFLLRERSASRTLKNELSVQAARVLFGHKLDPELMATIEEEIRTAEGPSGDSKTIREDIEAGLIPRRVGASLRGYDPKLVEEASAERAQHQADVINAQRGAKDFDYKVDDKGGRGEDKDPLK